MTPVVHYTLLSSEQSDGMDDDPGTVTATKILDSVLTVIATKILNLNTLL